MAARDLETHSGCSDLPDLEQEFRNGTWGTLAPAENFLVPQALWFSDLSHVVHHAPSGLALGTRPGLGR